MYSLVTCVTATAAKFSDGTSQCFTVLTSRYVFSLLRISNPASVGKDGSAPHNVKDSVTGEWR